MTRLCLLFCVVLTIVVISQERGKAEERNMSEELASSRLVRSPDAGAKRRKMRKGTKKKRQEGINRGIKSVSRTNSRAESDSCFEQVVTIMKMWKDVISNFEKQKKRMEKQNGTGSNKSGKKGAFSGVYQKLLSAGGGDNTHITCAGSSDSEGAAWLTNLTSSLAACQTDISSACDPASWPQPNMTKVVMCEELATRFTTGAQAESFNIMIPPIKDYLCALSTFTSVFI